PSSRTNINSAGESSTARASPGFAQRSSAWPMNHSRSSLESSAKADTLRRSAMSASMRAFSGISVMRFAAFQSLAYGLAVTGSLHLGQILMHELHHHGAFAYAGSH